MSTPSGDPTEDRARSPHTGWTRAHWEDLADRALRGAAPLLADSALPLEARLEAGARSFVLAAYRLHGAPPSDASMSSLAARYAETMTEVTDPSSTRAWTAIADRAQPVHEAGFVAIALWESRKQVWDQLDSVQQTRVVDWLAPARTAKAWGNSWLLSGLLVELFLRRVGAGRDDALVERTLAKVQTLAREGGWYTDGAGDNFDHYAAWGMHHRLAHAARMGAWDDDPAGRHRYEAQLRAFLGEYAHLFGADGAPLLQGRSATYRFAGVGSCFLGALLDATPLSPGTTRRLASGAARWFADAGLLDEHGRSAIGWRGAYPPLGERYANAGSPLAFGLAFAGLLLPPDHAVWTAVEAPLPAERGDFRIALRAPGFLAVGRVEDGIVRVASHRSDHHPVPSGRRDHPGYRKLAYSTATAPGYGPADDDDLDAQVVVHVRRGLRRRPAHRVSFDLLSIDDDEAASRWTPVVPDPSPRDLPYRLARRVAGRLHRVEVEVRSRFGAFGPSPADWEVRTATITGPRRPVWTDGGFAVAGPAPPAVEVAARWAVVRGPDGLTSAVVVLEGEGRPEARRYEGSSPFGVHAAVPFVRYRSGSRDTVARSVTAHVLTRGPFDPSALTAQWARRERW